MSSDIETVMRSASVIPVLVIDDLAHAEPIARALVAGGLRVLEVTLRTPCALDAIRAMREVEAQWRWVDAIRGIWAEAAGEVKPYAAGSWGPNAAIALTERDGRSWND